MAFEDKCLIQMLKVFNSNYFPAIVTLKIISKFRICHIGVQIVKMLSENSAVHEGNSMDMFIEYTLYLNSSFPSWIEAT